MTRARRLCLAAIATCLATGAVAAESRRIETSASTPRQVRIVNDTGQTLQAFYASHVRQRGWQPHTLGPGALGPGQSTTVRFDTDDYCVYDFRAVFANGAEAIRSRVNVCETLTFRYTDVR